MSKMTKNDRREIVKYYREIGKLAFKSNIKHHSVLDKNATHTNGLMRLLKQQIKENDLLKMSIDQNNDLIKIKNEHIDGLENTNVDHLWQLSKFEAKIKKLEQELENVVSTETSRAQHEKNIKKFIKDENVDN